MKIKTILASLFSAIAINGAIAGTAWCPPDKGGKCLIDDCPDIGGNISVGYDTDYIFKGVRFARDVVWGDVNYTFANLPLSPTFGVWHLTDLNNSAGTSFYGDETNLYAGINLPSILGFDNSLRYTHYLFPTFRGPSPGFAGDGLSEISLSMSRDLIMGISAGYTADYLWGGNGSNGWMHTLQLNKGFDLTDNVGLDITGGLLYNDGYYNDNVFLHGNAGNRGDSGWHSYFIRAALPIALNCRATLTPYIQYNGTPDGWTGDDLWGGSTGFNANRNDVLSSGLSLEVDF